jgi:hypothetical protein
MSAGAKLVAPKLCVAEVWLDWSITRGSTMYRASARSPALAQLKAKTAAMVLNALLPRYFMDTDWRGNPCKVPIEANVNYGVREPTAAELKDGIKSIWATTMPGTADFAGEHPSLHPWAAEPPEARKHIALPA